jgi:N-acyl-D-glutamate deacylase
MILIRRGLILDGTGKPGQIADVRIRDGMVTEVSPAELSTLPGERVIDAAGCWVMPGFLDTHTHYDAELLAAPGLGESVRHGVTTVCVGSCSLSTILSSAEDCADFFTRVEALPREHVFPALTRHKSWHSAEGYIAGLEARALGPNVAAFIGHSDMRVAVMGLERSVDPDERPTAAELDTMESLLNDALDAGFIGMSTMTNPWDKVGGERFRSRHLPSAYARWSEYRRLNRTLRRRGRVLQSAPNITTKLNVLLFLAESAGMGVRPPLKTALITAADPKANPMLAESVLALTRATNTVANADVKWQTVPVPFEVYADGMDLVVFEEFGAGEAALHLADDLARNELLRDTEYRRRFRKDYEKRWSPRVWHRDFHDAQIVAAPDTALVGKSFGQVADERKIHPVDAFLDLVVEYGSALRWKTTIANHRPRVLERLVSHPDAQIGFADSGAHVRNMAFYNFPLHFLRMALRAHQRGEPMMTIEAAVRRVTGELADWYGIEAGHVRIGHRADIAVIDPRALDETLDGYHEAPMNEMGGLMRMVRRNDAAVRATIIGGEIAWCDGEFADGFGTTRRFGQFLRAAEPPAMLEAIAVPALQAAE